MNYAEVVRSVALGLSLLDATGRLTALDSLSIVDFVTELEASAQLQLAGLSGPFACVAGTPDPANHRIADLNRLANVRWLKQWAKFGIRAVLTPRIIDPLRALVRSFRPDAICLDPLAYHGVVV